MWESEYPKNGWKIGREKSKFFVCNHVTFQPNDGQANNLWTIFLLSEWLQQEKLNGIYIIIHLVLSLKLSLNSINILKQPVFVLPARQLKSKNYVIANKEFQKNLHYGKKTVVHSDPRHFLLELRRCRDKISALLMLNTNRFHGLFILYRVN